MKTDLLRYSLITLLATSPLANAASFDDGGSTLQTVLDNHTVNADSSVNVVADAINDQQDSYWSVNGIGAALSVIVHEGAAADKHSFGIYDASDSNRRIELFGQQAAAGSQSIIGIKADGSVRINFSDSGMDFAANSFGFYLDTTASGGSFYFTDSSLNEIVNGESVDHVQVYQGTGDLFQVGDFAAGPWASSEYIFAWEDGLAGGSHDYADVVVMLESISPSSVIAQTPAPVPVPAGIWLLASGLLGLLAASRRRQA